MSSEFIEDVTGVEVNVSFHPFTFLLAFSKPIIEIDDKPIEKDWGKFFFPLEPGKHRITIYYPYLFFKKLGTRSEDVFVFPNQVVRVDYRNRLFFYGPGKMTTRNLSETA